VEGITEAYGYFVGAAGVLAALGTWYLNYRKQKSSETMEDRKYTDEQARIAIDKLVASLGRQVEGLTSDQAALKDQLKLSEEHRVKCELEMAEMKGEMKLMRFQLDRLMKHEEFNQRSLAVVQEAIQEKLVQ
jgi:hypothetical protein